MEDVFFEGETGDSDWLKLIDDAVSEAMDQFDIDSLAPTGTPKDWVGWSYNLRSYLVAFCMTESTRKLLAFTEYRCSYPSAYSGQALCFVSSQ